MMETIANNILVPSGRFNRNCFAPSLTLANKYFWNLASQNAMLRMFLTTSLPSSFCAIQDVKSLGCDDPIMMPPVTIDEAVSEGEEHAGDCI